MQGCARGNQLWNGWLDMGLNSAIAKAFAFLRVSQSHQQMCRQAAAAPGPAAGFRGSHGLERFTSIEMLM